MDKDKTVKVANRAPYPMTVPVYREVGDRSKKVGTIKFTTGQNYVDEDLWDLVKDDQRIQRRIGRGYLDVDKELSSRDKRELQRSASTALIEDLTTKAVEEDPNSGLAEDGRATEVYDGDGPARANA